MYQPGNLDASSLPAFENSLRVELEKLALQLAQPADYLALKTLYAAPKRIFDGQIVQADGTLWNPGGGAGVYVRVSGAWTKL